MSRFLVDLFENLSRACFFQPRTEIASERYLSCLRLGKPRLNLCESVSPLTASLLAKPESGTETPFQDPVPKQPIYSVFPEKSCKKSKLFMTAIENQATDLH